MAKMRQTQSTQWASKGRKSDESQDTMRNLVFFASIITTVGKTRGNGSKEGEQT